MMPFEQMIKQALAKRMFGNLQMPQNLNDPVQVFNYLQSSGQLKGFNIPQGMADPNQIIQYLFQTNQLTQEQYNQVMGQYMSMQGGNNGN